MRTAWKVQFMTRVLVAGMLAAVLAAGCGKPSGDATLAEVGDRRITAADFNEAYLRLQPPERPDLEDPEARRGFLQDLVNKDLMELAAFDMYPELVEQQQWRLERYRRQMLTRLLQQRLVGDLVEVTEAEKDLLYEHRQKDVMVDEIFVPTRDMADAMMERLEQGVPFEELALEYSILEYDDPERPGRVGWVSAGHYPWELESAVWSAPTGTIVPPHQDTKRGGWSIVRTVDSRKIPPESSREEMDAALDLALREPFYLARQAAVVDSIRNAAGPVYTPEGDALMMEKFYWEPPEHLKDDPMAFLNDPRTLPTLEADEETVTVIAFSTIPSWDAGTFINDILSWYPPGVWPRGQDLAQLHDVYDMVVRDMLLVAAAEDLGFDEDPDYVSMMDRRAAEMRVTYMYHNDIIAEVKPDDEDVQHYFEQNRDRYKAAPSYRMASFVSTDRAAMERLRDAWRAGTSFGELREEFQDAPGFQSIGETGWIAEGQDPGLDDFTASLEEGDVSDIFTRNDMHYVIRMLVRRPERLVSFEEAKDHVVPDATTWYQEEALKAFLKEQEARFGVKVHEKELAQLEAPEEEAATENP